MDDLQFALSQFNASVMNAANVAMASQTKKQDRKFTREMYERQLADNRENWRMMNEYNAPSAQMERLAQAGLNPNLIYGSGGVTGTTTIPNGSSANISYSQPPHFDPSKTGFSEYMALRQFQRQDAVIEAQLDKSRAETQNIRADSALKESQTGLNQIEAYVADALKDVKISKANEDLWSTQFKNYVDSETGLEIAKMEIAKSVAAIARLAVENNLSSKQMEAIAHDIAVKDATVKKIMADTNVSYAAAENIYDEMISRAIHDEMNVGKQQLTPFGNSNLGAVLNGIYNLNFYDGGLIRTVSDAYDRLMLRSRNRGVGDSKTEIRMPTVIHTGTNTRKYRKFMR